MESPSRLYAEGFISNSERAQVLYERLCDRSLRRFPSGMNCVTVLPNWTQRAFQAIDKAMENEENFDLDKDFILEADIL